jgi:thiol-disulfide isomerase/thioredoxin
MKTMFLLLMSIILCTTLSSQNTNQEISLDNGQKFLVGEITKEGLSRPVYAPWYSSNFKNYSPNETIISNIKEELQGYQVLAFLGTWCGDSKREVPRFLKILETANFPDDQLKIIALDRRKGKYKQSPTGEEWGLQILRVPTFIFYKNGREVNRIIESPNTTLEEDLRKILKTEGYIAQKAKSMHFD